MCLYLALEILYRHLTRSAMLCFEAGEPVVAVDRLGADSSDYCQFSALQRICHFQPVGKFVVAGLLEQPHQNQVHHPTLNHLECPM